MEREEAIRKISELIGHDLRPMADKYEVTVWKNVDGVLKFNKGWAGHVIERYLGLPLNSSRSPNFGSWELKVTSLKHLQNRVLTVKETMSVTKIDRFEVAQNTFEESHLYRKLRKMVVPARIWESSAETRSILHKVTTFDLDDPDLYALVKADYEEIRRVIQTEGFDALSGRMGKIIQPRTKGKAHGSKTRAFYVRKNLVSYMLGMGDKPE